MFEGLYCEHEATSYCSDDGSVSRTSFCTNGGSCIELVGDEKAGFACDCPAAYIGDHCQFIAGSQPEDWDTPAFSVTNEGSGSGSKGGAIAGLTIGLIVVIIAAAFFAKKRPEAFREAFFRKKGEDSDDAAVAAVDEESKSPTKSTGSRDELQLDADGGVLKEALSEEKSSAMSRNKIDSMENEEDLESNSNKDLPTSPSAEDAEIL